MSHTEESPCCGTLGIWLMKILIVFSIVLTIIGMICIWVGGAQIYAVPYEDYSADNAAYNSILGNFVSCGGYYDFVLNNDSVPATYWSDETARNWELGRCIAPSSPIVYFFAMTGVLLFFVTILTTLYWWKDWKQLYYWAFSLSTVSLFMMFTCFIVAGSVTSTFIWRLMPCEDVDVADYNAIVYQQADPSRGFLGIMGPMYCIDGRDRADITISPAPTITHELKSAFFWLRQVATLYAGCALGIVAMIVSIGVFSVYPPYS